MKFEPWEWQVKDAQTIVDNGGTALLAIEPGGTKTLISVLARAEMKPAVTLIIAPKSTIESPLSAWPKTIDAVTGETVRLIGNSNKTTKQALFDFEFGYPGVYATTPQFMTRHDVSTWSGDMLISDESHGLTTAKTKGQRKWSGYDVRKDLSLASRFTSRLALSGTPMRQDFQNMWATMRFLWPDQFRRGDIAYDNYYGWMLDRMTKRNIRTNQLDRFGNKKTVTQYLAEKQEGLLFSQMPCVIQHKRRERCCEYHPNGFLTTEKPNVYYRDIELTVKQKKALHGLETQLMAWIDDNPLVINLSLTQKQRINQLVLGEARVEEYDSTDAEGQPVVKTRLEYDEDCISPFADEVFEILDELPRDEPAVIYLESQRFAKVMTAKLNKRGIKAQEYSGKAKANLYRLGLDYRVLVGVISAMGTGTDGLQDRCNTEIFLEPPGHLTNSDQILARLDRVGSRQVQRYILHDNTGYNQGRYSVLVENRLQVARSMRVEA